MSDTSPIIAGPFDTRCEWVPRAEGDRIVWVQRFVIVYEPPLQLRRVEVDDKRPTDDAEGVKQ